MTQLYLPTDRARVEELIRKSDWTRANAEYAPSCQFVPSQGYPDRGGVEVTQSWQKAADDFGKAS